MINNRVKSLLAKNKDVGLMEGMNSMIPGKNSKGDIIAYWIFVGSLAVIMLTIAVIKAYSVLSHLFNKEI
jgi:hypothetical protein